MPRDKSGNAARFESDRAKRYTPKTEGGQHRERNVGHNRSEEHNRDNRRRQGK